MAEKGGESPGLQFTHYEDPYCPTCGATDFSSWSGVKKHHRLKHEEKLMPFSSDWLREQYWEKGKSGKEIADIIGVEPNTVRGWMEELDVERRDKYEARAEGELGLLKDADWLREQYLERGRSSNEIGEQLGVSGNAVLSWLERHGIERKDKAEARTDGRIELLKDEEWLREQYLDEKKSGPEIGRLCGVDNTTVYTYLEKYGIERRDISDAKTDGNLELVNDCDWLSEQYVDKQGTASEIAEKCELGTSTVIRKLDECGIERRGPMDAARSEGRIDLLKDERWLREKYLQEEWSTIEIAEHCGVAHSTVHDHMKRHGIERRSISEAMTEGNFDRLSNADWLEKQHIEKGRTAQEIGSEIGVTAGTVITWFKRHGIDQRTHVNYANPDHLDHAVRSQWELRFAELLLDLGVDYEYESLEIEAEEGRTYTPDFVTEEYVIEVKGRVYDFGIQNAKKALDQLDDREYVVVGSKRALRELPADHHFLWENRLDIQNLFDRVKID